jgi:hypothetical protein
MGQCKPCVVCGKEGLEEVGKKVGFIKDSERKVNDGKKMYVLCV